MIRIAQIGTSKYSHGNEIFATVKKNSDVFEIVGYAMPERERERLPFRMSEFEGYREMTVDEILSDPTIDAVLIETDEIYLTKYALMAARAGKHVHMEKPGGISLSDFEEMISVMKSNGKVFHTGYMYRYNPVISDIIKRVRAGELGDIISVEAQMSGWRGKEHTEWLEVFPGGMMFYLGCHLVDLVLQIQGKPKRIIPLNKSTGVYDTGAKDFSFAVFEYDRGVSYIKTTQAERGGFLKRRLIVTGTKGRIELCPLEVSVEYPLQYTEYSECMSAEWGAVSNSGRSEVHDRYDAMMLSFAKMVSGEMENPCDYDYELELFKTIKKCCE
ncbi:MAG: Gfo/Idh/MocA family oxidoreductase [Clostridia bacterium]|nr:Gfo/Idh/MocA family oxidoreductase [Clostridia bacterium]